MYFYNLATIKANFYVLKFFQEKQFENDDDKLEFD